MGRKINIDIKEMLDKIQQLIITQEDCGYIFKTEQVTNDFYRLYKLYQQGNYNINLIEEFLIDNKDDIDKENLMLILAKNCKYQLIGLEDYIKEELIKKTTTENEVKIKMAKINAANQQKKMIENTSKYVIQNAKGIDKILTFYRHDNDKKEYILDVADSRELIDKKHVSSVRNLKRFEKIDNSFEEGDNNIGIGYILQVLNLSDLKEIFPDQETDIDNRDITLEESRAEKIERETKSKKFGIDVMRLIYDRKILREGILSYEELKKTKQNDLDKYNEIISKMKDDIFTLYIKEVIREYIKYVDIDKLLLIAAYRFNYGLETIEDKTKTAGYEEIIKVIQDNIENSKAEIFCNLEYVWDEKVVMAEVEYSVEKLNKFASKFVDNQYITEKEIKGNKEKIESQERLLEDIDSRYIDIMFSKEELESYANLNIENLEFVYDKLGWDKEKVLEIIIKNQDCSTDLLIQLIQKQMIDSTDIITLYLNNNINKEQIEDLKQIINLEEVINSHELIQYYKNSIEKNSTEEDKNKFDKYVEIYIGVLIDNKESEELEETYNKLVDSLLDNYQGEEYIKVATEFYKKGLVTLEILAEWNEEKIIDAFYKQQIIDLTHIVALAKSNKLSFEYISNIYKELINKTDIEYDERLSYIKTGYIPEKEIFKLYENGFIFEKDLRDLAENGIVRIIETEKLINARTKEDLEKKSSIKLVGLNELRKINNEIYLEEEEFQGKRERKEKQDREDITKLIIDPNKREEYINIFNAFRAETDLEEDSPFYNYEFYVIPDESGGIGLNSVVIAERYYENKDTEEKFALNNATYFFRYKDLMVLSNLKKSEMTKERENVVFTAKHTLADENKNGYWAAGVIYAVAKTMLSSDLKDYTKTEQRKIVLEKFNQIYPEEKILEILDMASKIDSGDYTYEIVNPEDKILRKSAKSKNKEKTNEEELR